MCIDPILAFYSYKSKKFIHFRKLYNSSKEDLIHYQKISGRKDKLAGGYWQIISCHKCIGCQLDRSIEWKTRLINEAKYYKNNMSFITLTYDDDHLPKNKDKVSILKKSDVQDFLKRLRYYFKKDIRYFVAGEYGTKTKRPHYHIIFFGLSLDDFSDLSIDHKEDGFVYYNSCFFEYRIWKKGKCILTKVDDKCIGYVAGYCVKKVNKDIAWSDIDLVKPFILTSKMGDYGSIGSRFIIENKEDIINNNMTFLTHYDNKTFISKVPVSQRRLLLDMSSKDYKTIYYQSKKNIHYDLNNLDAYCDMLEHSPFVHSSKYFQNRADKLLDKLSTLKSVN